MLKISGMVDPHVHLRGMQWSHKGSFDSETAAAIAGGYWAVLDMPNTPPSTIDPAALDAKLAIMAEQAVCDWGVYFGATQADNSGTFADVAPPVCGLKIYNNATTGNLLVEDQALRERLYAAWPQGKVIAVHAEDETVLAILALVRRFRNPTHFCHISTAQEIAYLEAAKEEGLPVTVGVTPHHLLLTEDDIQVLGPFGLMKPELKTKADQQALWAAIASGVVDVVESDHAPHTLEEKKSDKPPYGVPGLETTLPLLCTAVQEGRLAVERMVELVATAPCRIFGLAPPDNTYTIVDMDAQYVIDRESLWTKCGWSPFEGLRVSGKVQEVWIRGTKVFDGQEILVPNAFGRNLCG